MLRPSVYWFSAIFVNIRIFRLGGSGAAFGC